MHLVQYAAPTVEPITLSELKMHLGLSSETLAGDSAMYTCLAAGSHAVQDNYTTHIGTAIDVLGKQAVVYLQPVNNGAGGTVDCKIQESDDNATWTDVTSGAFTQVTEANDTAIQEKAYTGIKRYIRTVAKVLVAACEFGTSVFVLDAVTPIDDLLTSYIETARRDVENDTGRQLITATWDYYPQRWPDGDRLKLPFGNLSSVTSVKYKDTDGTETTMTVTTDYLVETNGDQCGFIVLPYGCSWPSTVLYPSNPISIRFVCGYGATGASVPSTAKTAIKFRCAKYFESRGDDSIGQAVTEDKSYDRLIDKVPRLYDRDFL